MEAPETRYARSGDVSIASHVLGDGPFDLVRGVAELEGVPGEWRLFAVEQASSA